MECAAFTIQRAPRGRPYLVDGRQAFRLFPGNTDRGTRFLYALGYADGRTKIGIAINPRKRIFAHWRASNRGIEWAHVFSPVGRYEAEKVEGLALAFAASESARIRATEEFTGLPKVRAIACVRAALAIHLADA